MLMDMKEMFMSSSAARGVATPSSAEPSAPIQTRTPGKAPMYVPIRDSSLSHESQDGARQKRQAPQAQAAPAQQQTQERQRAALRPQEGRPTEVCAESASPTLTHVTGGDVLQRGAHQVKTPFAPHIMAADVRKLKPPPIKPYDGKGDPESHLDQYAAYMCLRDAPDAAWCRAFPVTLTGVAQTWFQKLTPGSVGSFEELKARFLAQFISGRIYHKSVSVLFAQ